MAEIVWTEKSVNHLEAIFKYIANDSEYYAKHFITSLINATQKLKTHPLCGRVVSEMDREDIRELIYRNYRIVYRISEKNDKVDILAVIHSARDFTNVFKFQ